jgi:large subunit ribosomal protein L25
MLTLSVEKREKGHKLSEIRKNGKIPAVFYGRKETSTPISLKEVDFLKAWKEAGESTVVVLKGVGGEHEALIHDIDKDPVTGRVRHADFYILEKGKKVKVGVPIEFIGISPAVQDMAGTLVKVLHELEIEALPKDLPHKFEVDISSLINFESRILAKNIKLPSGVELAVDKDEVVALVTEAKEEIVEETEPVDLSAIEVEEKGKKKEEGEEEPGAETSAPAAKKEESKPSKDSKTAK